MKFSQLLLLTALFLIPILGHSAAPAWSTDLAKAQAQARVEGKAVLINFTGSDWCGWCMKLRKDVFLKPDFAAYAQTNLVLVEIDFPKRKTLSPEVQKANQRLEQQFQVQGFPTLVLLDRNGTRLSNVNYANGGTRTFLAEVERILRPPSDNPPAKPANKKPATPKRYQSATTSALTNQSALTLSRITGTKKKRQAIINNTTFVAGQTATVKSGITQLKIHCVEIRERSAIVTINGQPEKRVLQLASGI